MSFHHIPVMQEEVIAALAPQPGQLFVDCTAGGGGHSFAILETGASVIALDRDPDALAAATERCAPHADRFQAVHSAFSDLDAVLEDRNIAKVDGIFADLGVSSHQLDTAERGFSFRFEGPVDMRMDPTRGETAAELIARSSEDDLIKILREFGEERRARRVARVLKEQHPFADTASMASAVAAVVPKGKSRIHPATRTFQALRIAVNAELSQLHSLLPTAVERLLPGGRLAFLTFHSLEDRIVKRFFATASGRTLPRDPWGHPIGPVTLSVSRSVAPSPSDPNPRARSSRLRAAVRLPCPAP